jgi:hypothetical protein
MATVRLKFPVRDGQRGTVRYKNVEIALRWFKIDASTAEALRCSPLEDTPFAECFREGSTLRALSVERHRSFWRIVRRHRKKRSEALAMQKSKDAHHVPLLCTAHWDALAWYRWRPLYAYGVSVRELAGALGVSMHVAMGTLQRSLQHVGVRQHLFTRAFMFPRVALAFAQVLDEPLQSAPPVRAAVAVRKRKRIVSRLLTHSDVRVDAGADDDEREIKRVAMEEDEHERALAARARLMRQQERDAGDTGVGEVWNAASRDVAADDDDADADYAGEHVFPLHWLPFLHETCVATAVACDGVQWIYEPADAAAGGGICARLYSIIMPLQEAHTPEPIYPPNTQRALLLRERSLPDSKKTYYQFCASVQALTRIDDN